MAHTSFTRPPHDGNFIGENIFLGNLKDTTNRQQKAREDEAFLVEEILNEDPVSVGRLRDNEYAEILVVIEKIDDQQ